MYKGYNHISGTHIEVKRSKLGLTGNIDDRRERYFQSTSAEDS